MWPFSPWAVPTGSFNLPVPPPGQPLAGCDSMTVTFPSEWQPYILAALLQLTLQATWQGDEAAIIDAQGRAYAIIQTIQAATCVVPPEMGSMEVDFDMGIRVDCDCRVFVECCDGSEVELLTTKNPGQPQAGSPTGGNPIAKPGSQATTCYTMDVKSIQVLSQTVSTGDKILFENLLGSWYDTLYANIIKCIDGYFYIEGFCFEDLGRLGTDPLPSVPHLALIAKIGSTFYDPLQLDIFGNPTEFTVPAGVSNEQVYLQANAPALTGMYGTGTFCVKITNNAAVAWSHTLDFRVAPYGFADASAGGGSLTWTPGTGFTGGGGPGADVRITHALSGTITRVIAVGSVPGMGASSYLAIEIPIGTLIHNVAPVTTNPVTNDTGVISAGGSTIDLTASDNGLTWTATFISIQIMGTGTDPFPAAPTP